MRCVWGGSSLSNAQIFVGRIYIITYSSSRITKPGQNFQPNLIFIILTQLKPQKHVVMNSLTKDMFFKELSVFFNSIKIRITVPTSFVPGHPGL